MPLPHSTLSPKAMTLAMGIATGSLFALFALFSMVFDVGTDMIYLIASIYRGFGPSVPGMIAGFFWGFIEGGVWGWLLAVLYNHFLRA